MTPAEIAKAMRCTDTVQTGDEPCASCRGNAMTIEFTVPYPVRKSAWTKRYGLMGFKREIFSCDFGLPISQE